jgi:hypothetical protein
VQQKVTELAIKGDRALSTLRPIEERPRWATFDDEDEEPPAPNGASTVTELRPAQEPSEDTAAATAAHATAVAAAGGEVPRSSEPAAADPSGPNVLPGYEALTIPQLRGRLRFLSVDELHALLEWEKAHENRPPFVTMLSNRITTVTET